MLSKRIIACLDVRDGQVVKGIRFYTANDRPDRDPQFYFLEGTNDDPALGPAAWFQIRAETLSLPAGRNVGGNVPVNPATHFNQTFNFFNDKSFKFYRIIFSSVQNSAISESERPCVGSSRIRTDGLSASPIATSTRRWWP